MRRSVVLPTRSLYLGPGPTSGRRHGPTPGFGFDFETTSDQIDSGMPQKTHPEGPQDGELGAGAGGEEIGANALGTITTRPTWNPVVWSVSLYRATFWLRAAPVPGLRQLNSWHWK